MKVSVDGERERERDLRGVGTKIAQATAAEQIVSVIAIQVS